MDSLPQYILDTFVALWPQLRANPDELAARLQRRLRAMLNRPPRAWCIELRAGDTRMTPWDTTIDDRHAIDQHRPHTVTIDPALVRRLIAPVTIHPPGEPWTDVAARLGVHEESLRRAMNLGRFAVHHIPPFSRRPGSRGRGKPVPLIYRPGLLNPCAEKNACPDLIWGSLWPYHADIFAASVPAEFSQTLERHPRWRPYRGQPRFRGWTWRCPACRKAVEMIYFPLPVPDIATYLRLHEEPRPPRQDGAGEASESPASLASYTLRLIPPPQPLSTFACVRCHRVRYLSRTDRNGWNEFVAYLTCGLLYGREVPMPPDWHQRRRDYHPHRRPQAPRTAAPKSAAC